MSKIVYQVEGKACLDGDELAQVCAITWQRGGGTATVHSGGAHLRLSGSQLLQLAELAQAIADDLVGGGA